MLSIAAIAFMGTAYPPPSTAEAFEAFSSIWFSQGEGFGNAGREITLRSAAEFPIAIELLSCVSGEKKNSNSNAIYATVTSGYFCIQEVFPTGGASFQTFGFYFHDGIEWKYSGQYSPTAIPTPNQFDPLPRRPAQAKPGSLLYDGNPAHPFNEVNDPYRDLFKDLDAFWYSRDN